MESEYDLHDVVANDVPMGHSVEYMGFFVMSAGPETFIVQYEGHLGEIDQFRADEYDDVLDLVDVLNSHVVRLHSLRNDRDALVEWAGPIVTEDEAKAEASDDYVYVPDPADMDGSEEIDVDTDRL